MTLGFIEVAKVRAASRRTLLDARAEHATPGGNLRSQRVTEGLLALDVWAHVRASLVGGLVNLNGVS